MCVVDRSGIVFLTIEWTEVVRLLFVVVGFDRSGLHVSNGLGIIDVVFFEDSFLGLELHRSCSSLREWTVFRGYYRVGYEQFFEEFPQCFEICWVLIEAGYL